MSTRNRAEPLSFHHLQALTPFEPNSVSKALQLRFSVQRTLATGIEFSFSMTADQSNDLSSILIPSLKAPAERLRKDELWRHTCLEVFVGPENGASYLELNLSPSGDWNIYAFDSYRAGMRAAQPAVEPLVSYERSVDGTALTWKGQLVSAVAEEGDMDRVLAMPSLVMGATAVLEYRNGEREYWALEHAGSQPDFHLRKSFRLKL